MVVVLELVVVVVAAVGLVVASLGFRGRGDSP